MIGFILEVLEGIIYWYIVLTKSLRKKIWEFMKVLLLLGVFVYIYFSDPGIIYLPNLYFFILIVFIATCLTVFVCQKNYDLHTWRGCLRKFFNIDVKVQNLQFLLFLLWPVLAICGLSCSNCLKVLLFVFSTSYIFHALLFGFLEKLFFKFPILVGSNNLTIDGKKKSVTYLVMPTGLENIFPCTLSMSYIGVRRIIAYSQEERNFSSAWKRFFISYVILQISWFLFITYLTYCVFNLHKSYILIFLFLWSIIIAENLIHTYFSPNILENLLSRVLKGLRNKFENFRVFTLKRRVGRSCSYAEDRHIYRYLENLPFSFLNNNAEHDFVFSVFLVLILTVVYASVIGILSWTSYQGVR
jgi:hypothetical protein